MNSVALVIQARMGSSRLPGKVGKTLIDDVSMLACLLRRMKASRTVDKLIVATSDLSQDDGVVDIARAEGVDIFRGSETDVLGRFAGALQSQSAQYTVRICADSPIHDAEIVDRCVDRMLQNPQLEYVSNMRPETYPYGLAVEVLPTQLLLTLDRVADKPYYREHVTSYIAEHRNKFRTDNVSHDNDLSAYRVVVDYAEDLDLARIIYARLYPQNPLFSWRDAIKLLETDERLVAINAGRNDRLRMSPNSPAAVDNYVLPGNV